MESELLGKMHTRIVQNFLDVAILLELYKRPLSEADVISLIQNKHQTLLNSEKTSSCLCCLEKNGLVKTEPNISKGVFELTDRGKEVATELLKEKTSILGLLLNLFVVD